MDYGLWGRKKIYNGLIIRKGGAMAQFPKRHGISRARFFLQKAVECNADQRDEFEAYLDAAIIFARTALLRVESDYKNHPDWKLWWNNLLTDCRTTPAVEFLRHERNHILHQAPARINQRILAGYTQKFASELYYYEIPETPPTRTVEKHIDTTENIILDADKRFRWRIPFSEGVV